MEISEPPFDFKALHVFPLKERKSLSRTEATMVSFDAAPPAITDEQRAVIEVCAEAMRQSRRRQAAMMLIYGAHLVKNGAGPLVGEFIRRGWITHLATNGAGTIHDWEFAAHGESTESVRENVATGTFGMWEETGRVINLSVLVGGLEGLGFGAALGRCMVEDGLELPEREALAARLREEPGHPRSPARAELLRCMLDHGLAGGRVSIRHPWKATSIVGTAHAHGVPLTVHPGIGYDIFTNHPMFNGAAIGRAAAVDFRQFCSTVERLDYGVVLSVGSAIMGPQVFEKSMSCVNNLRLQTRHPIVHNHSLFVVDLQDGGGWDWSAGEPPRDNPAYYLRFCKSYSRMGGAMHYFCGDNVAFLHHLLYALNAV